MNASIKWLKDYVEINVTPEELAEKLTSGGIEVESITKLGDNITNVVAGEVLEIEKHPEADKLVICKVKVNEEGEVLTIVTGAPNVRIGMKIPVALVGACLPNGLKIKKSKLRGVPSFGMMCSADELQLDGSNLPEDEQNGIMSVPADTVLGTPIQQVLGLDDTVLELGLTPNRADCLSMLNIAREVSTLLGTALKLPEIKAEGSNENLLEELKITVEAQDLCPRYIGRVVKNIKIGPSPAWLKERIEAAGMRSISNIVDITNFVMLETGQPLHAFDYDKIANRHLIIRRAVKAEKIITLDGNEHELNEDVLTICDEEKPVALAGIMGGLNSEITEETSTIILESAYFNQANIRKNARNFGIRSEASSRFEKGINIDGCLDAVNRAVDLIEALACGERVAGKVEFYNEKKEPIEIDLKISRVNQILGTALSKEQIIGFLSQLKFPIQDKGENILVTIPTYRLDISQPIDLIEEVARLYGLDNIPTGATQGVSTQETKSKSQLLAEKICNLLVGMGLTELINYSFINPKFADKLLLDNEDSLRNVIQIKNPLSEDQSVMRTTLIPGILDAAARNIRRRQSNLAVFELGRVFLKDEENVLPREEAKLVALVTGQKVKTWQEAKYEMDFFYLKGILEELLKHLNVGKIEFVAKSAIPYLHPGRSAELKVNGESIGLIGEVHPEVIKNYDLDQRACVLELSLTPLIADFSKVKMYEALPKYPASERDMALLIPEEVNTGEIEEAILAVGGKYLKQFRLFDIYRGKQIPAGYKSMAFNLVYQAKDRTLTDEEVQKMHQKIQDALQSKYSAQLR